MVMPVEILLAEDNPADAKLTLIALKHANVGNRVHVVENGEQALEFIFGNQTEPANSPKLVLLDLKMPRVGGIEVLEKMKSDPRTKSIPVVVLTSSNHDKDLERCYKLGANSYIVKPVDFDQFMKVIKEVGLYWILVNKLPGQ